MSEQFTFGVIKTIMPCAEGDRSDCHPQQLLLTSDLGFGQKSLPKVDNPIYHPQHRA